MENRTKITLQLTTADKIFEAVGWIAVLSIWILILTTYSKLPETIPTHYNGNGEADGFGGKENILALPIVSTIMFVALTILNKFPYAFNYPVDITDENRIKQYTNATRLIRYLKFIIVIIFGMIALETILSQISKPKYEGLGTWFLPITLGLIFIPIAYFVTKSMVTKKQ